jgi:hypothetical protein
MPGISPAPAALGELLPGSVKELTGLQKTGFVLAIATLVGIALVSAELLLWQSALPSVPNQLTADQIQLWERWAKLHDDYAKATTDRVPLPTLAGTPDW